MVRNTGQSSIHRLVITLLCITSVSFDHFEGASFAGTLDHPVSEDEEDQLTTSVPARLLQN
jgi:hypothetical protein